MSVLFTDDFSGGSIGTAWAAHRGTWSQAGGVVSQTSLAPGDVFKKLQVDSGPVFPTDLEVLCRVRVDSQDSDNLRFGLALGGDSSGFGYELQLTPGVLSFYWDLNHGSAAFAPFTWSVGTWYWLRFRQQSVSGVNTLFGKVWADGATEPTGWMATSTEFDSLAGAPGLLGGHLDGGKVSFDDFSVSDLGGADTTPPTLAGTTVPTGGTTLTATLSESGCGPASGSGGFSLGGTAAVVSSWAIAGTTLTLALTGPVYSGEPVALSYSRAATTDDVHDAAGNFLADFSAATVTNNSTQVAAASSGALDPQGDLSMLRNTAGQKLLVFAYTASTRAPLAGDAAHLSAFVSKDHGTPAALADTSATELSAANATGFYLFDLAQAETDADILIFTAKSTTSGVVVLAVPAVVQTETELTSVPADVTSWAGTATDAASLVVLARGIVATAASPASFTATIAGSNLLAVSGAYAGRTLNFQSGSLATQPRTITGYTVSAGTAGFDLSGNPLTSPPAPGDAFVIG